MLVRLALGSRVYALIDAGDRRTLPLLALTQGRLTLLMKVTSGGLSGYWGPQWILRE